MRKEMREMELLILLDGRSKIPLYEQIYRHIKAEIRAGRLGAGERLPSTRTLADNLKVSRSTAQLAYDQLLSEGYVASIPCRGYFVAGIEELVEVKEQPGGAFVTQEENEQARYAVDFSPRGIDLDSFPFHTWRKLSRNTLVDDNKAMFAGGDPQGEYSLRAAIGNYLHSARGVNVHPEQIVVGAGSEYLWLLLSQILGMNHCIAMENPTYKQAYRVFHGMGYPVVPVEMDANGMNVEELEASGADVAYVMPAHQYPTGIVMPVRRRQELLLWAAKEPGRYLIEDDYDSEFRYKGKPIPALQGMDGTGRVIYIGTFSKSIAPAIRVGFLVLPKELLARYREKAGFYSSTVSRIDQNILYQFLVEGHYERHLNRMRAVYKAKHDALLAGLRTLESVFEIRGEYAGLHVLLTHRGGRAEEELLQRAQSVGVKVYGMSGCFIHPQHCRYSSTVLLGYASLSEEEIVRGTRLLTEVWKE